MPDILYIDYSKRYICTHCGVILKRAWEFIPGEERKGVVFYCMTCNKRYYTKRINIKEELE